MSKHLTKILIYPALLMLIGSSVSAESLFQTGVSQAVYPMRPKSLFNTIKAKTIGDIITIIIDENALTTNNVKLTVSDNSSMGDSFSSTLNNIFSSHRKGVRTDIPDLDGFGGTSSTSNSANVQRSMQLTDTITAQVVQVLPNGNLVVQGKKVAINSGEKTQIIISGIVDPRFITNAGTIQSKNIANLQFASIGNGTVSRHDSEGLINRIFTQLF